MNRRKFFGFVGGAAAIGAAAVVPSLPTIAATKDDFTHNGYRLRWRDYQTPANQSVCVGMWHAKHTTRDLQWVSTTTGQCYPSRDWEVVDMTIARDWPKLTLFSDEAEKVATKQRALDALILALDKAPLL